MISSLLLRFWFPLCTVCLTCISRAQWTSVSLNFFSFLPFKDFSNGLWSHRIVHYTLTILEVEAKSSNGHIDEKASLISVA